MRNANGKANGRALVPVIDETVADEGAAGSGAARNRERTTTRGPGKERGKQFKAEYATGARLHTSRVSLERADKAHWKLAFFILLSFFPVMIGVMVWLAMSVPKTQVFAVQRDSAGNTVPLGPVTPLEPPNIAQRKVALTRWLQELYITTDEVSQKHFIDRVYGMVGSGTPAEGTVDGIYRNPAFDPKEMRKNHQHLTITVPGVDSSSDTDFKTDYVVRRYNQDNSVDATYKRHATFKVVFDDSVDSGSLWVNPYRIFITDFNDEPGG